MKRGIFVFWVFLLGLFAGVGAMLVWFHSGKLPEEQTSGSAAEELLANEAMLLDRIREKDAEIARLRTELASTSEAVEVPAPEEEVEEAVAAPDPEDERRARFMERMDERISRRSAGMAEKYGLSEEQAEALNAVFMDQFEAFRARRRGEEGEPFSLDEAIAGVLTGEQFEQYLEDTQQEIYERAELLATTQLVRMTQRMELAPEVQDEVYEAIHYTAQEMMIARQTGEDFNMREIVDARLGSVLTEEQMQIYRETAWRGPGRGQGMGPGP